MEITVKGEGGTDVTKKLPIKELRKGYMLQQDYSRKTAELARQRESVGEETRKAIESERAVLQQTLQQMQSTVIDSIAPELKSVDWNYLATNDQPEYIRLRNRADQIQKVLGEIQSKQSELSKKQQAEMAESQRKAALHAREVLEAKIPNWSDDHYKALMKTAVDYGYKPEQVASWVDPVAFQILHDAHEYRQMKNDKSPLNKRVVTPPVVVKPGAASAPAAAKAAESDAMKRLQKSGNFQDAAAVIKSRMG